jgi:hypothetical protein
MDHLRVAAEYSKIAASVHYAGLHVEAAQGLDCPIGREAFRNSSEINPDIGASEADGFSWKQFDRIRQLRPGWNWGIAGGARQKSHRLQVGATAISKMPFERRCISTAASRTSNVQA